MKPSSSMRSNERGCCAVGFHGPAANWGAQFTWPSSSSRTIPATMNNTRFDSGGFLVFLVTSRIGHDTDDFSFFFLLTLSIPGISVSMTYIYVFYFIYFITDEFLLIVDDAIVGSGSRTWCRINLLNRIYCNNDDYLKYIISFTAIRYFGYIIYIYI